MISVSIVSHGHGVMLAWLLQDLARHSAGYVRECLLTLNIPEPLPFDPSAYPFTVRLIENSQPLGFGANHNRAFELSQGEFFCVLNPDIRLLADPFAQLLGCFGEAAVALAVPLVVDSQGRIEDSARRFPSPFRILCKAFGRCYGGDYEVGEALLHPEWVGGMFMLFPHDSFAAINGFDELFFLYYEDVDLCFRLRLGGRDIVLNPAVRVVHDAQRASRRQLQYLRWHSASMLRYFTFDYPRWLWHKFRVSS